MRFARVALVVSVALGACKGAERPRVLPAAAQTIAIGRDGTSLRGVAGDGTVAYAAFSRTAADAPRSSTVEARRAGQIVWTGELAGTAGEIAIAGTQLGVAMSAKGNVAIGTAFELRGDPAGVFAALDRTSGHLRWRLAFDSTEWALISSVSSIGTDFLVGGSFGGTLRVGAKVVSSAGGSDGFVARVDAQGKLVWLVRLGGIGSDAVQGVASDGKARVAIAGTFSPTADILGHAFAAQDERLPYGDAFVVELDGGGAWKWQSSFGSRADDAVAGVALDRSGRVVVAATVRDVVKVGSQTLMTGGAGDGLVVWFGDGGEIGATTIVGGGDFDGFRSIAAVGDHVAVGGFFSGGLKLGDREVAAGGGDDSFVVALDPNGTVVTAWHVSGAGREEITAVTAIPGGFVAGVAHTAAASIDGANLAAPKDPASGAALVVRGL